MPEKYQVRPSCNMIPGCDKPGVVLVGTKICCERHLMLYVKKQEEMNNKVIEEMMKDAE
jgi:hypothetical protein